MSSLFTENYSTWLGLTWTSNWVSWVQVSSDTRRCERCLTRTSRSPPGQTYRSQRVSATKPTLDIMPPPAGETLFREFSSLSSRSALRNWHVEEYSNANIFTHSLAVASTVTTHTSHWQHHCPFLSLSTNWHCFIRYDTIRDAILTCARKPTWVSLIYRTLRPQLAVPSLPALGPWAPPAERGPSGESIYRVSLTVALCEG